MSNCLCCVLSPELHEGRFVVSSAVAQEHVCVVEQACAQLRRMTSLCFLDAGESLRNVLPETTGDHGQINDGLQCSHALLVTLLVQRRPSARQTRHHEIIHQLRTSLFCHHAGLDTTGTHTHTPLQMNKHLVFSVLNVLDSVLIVKSPF